MLSSGQYFDLVLEQCGHGLGDALQISNFLFGLVYVHLWRSGLPRSTGKVGRVGHGISPHQRVDKLFRLLREFNNVHVGIFAQYFERLFDLKQGRRGGAKIGGTQLFSDGIASPLADSVPVVVQIIDRSDGVFPLLQRCFGSSSGDCCQGRGSASGEDRRGNGGGPQ
mmetsp:Transcript_17011/g.19582  ORF Transcript_17011/g.19582 Transcript_17011/m.19582 type:complete len:167 (+) Transcript_17011:458-958(+)